MDVLSVTSGGEAMASQSVRDIPKPNRVVMAPEVGDDAASAQWYVIWTHGNCEWLVYKQLVEKEVEAFLPTVHHWSLRRGKRIKRLVPLFAGYLFVRQQMTKRNYLEVVNARGVARILGERWDRLATIPDDEIENIRRVVISGLPHMPYPYVREGDRVRITEGRLAGVEGTLTTRDSRRGLLVVSIEMLRRSVAVEVPCTEVAAA